MSIINNPDPRIGLSDGDRRHKLPNYYRLIGCSQHAPVCAIQKKLKRAFLKWHPDRAFFNKYDRKTCTKVTAALNAAKTILLDPFERAHYNDEIDTHGSFNLVLHRRPAPRKQRRSTPKSRILAMCDAARANRDSQLWKEYLIQRDIDGYRESVLFHNDKSPDIQDSTEAIQRDIDGYRESVLFHNDKSPDIQDSTEDNRGPCLSSSIDTLYLDH